MLILPDYRIIHTRTHYLRESHAIRPKCVHSEVDCLLHNTLHRGSDDNTTWYLFSFINYINFLDTQSVSISVLIPDLSEITVILLV